MILFYFICGKSLQENKTTGNLLPSLNVSYDLSDRHKITYTANSLQKKKIVPVCNHRTVEYLELEETQRDR